MLKLLITLCCLSLPSYVYASELYKIVDVDGEITFTDIAPEIDAKQYQPGYISAVKNPNFNSEKVKEMEKEKADKAASANSDNNQ